MQPDITKQSEVSTTDWHQFVVTPQYKCRDLLLQMGNTEANTTAHGNTIVSSSLPLLFHALTLRTLKNSVLKMYQTVVLQKRQ